MADYALYSAQQWLDFLVNGGIERLVTGTLYDETQENLKALMRVANCCAVNTTGSCFHDVLPLQEIVSFRDRQGLSLPGLVLDWNADSGFWEEKFIPGKPNGIEAQWQVNYLRHSLIPRLSAAIVNHFGTIIMQQGSDPAPLQRLLGSVGQVRTPPMFDAKELEEKVKEAVAESGDPNVVAASDATLQLETARTLSTVFGPDYRSLLGGTK